MADADAFVKALKKARLSEAAQLDAITNLRDAGTLRLEALRDALLPQLRDNAQAQAMFELNVQDGDRPRLWIDLVSAVEMWPDPKTYALTQHRDGHRETLFETRDLQEMQRFALGYLAHRMVAKERMAAGLRERRVGGPRYSLSEMIYVWLTGLLFGVLGLVAWALATGHLKF